jgi:hypothetical protein
MYELQKKRTEKVFMSKFVGTGPSSYGKRIYWAGVSQRLINTALPYSSDKGQSVNSCGGPFTKKRYILLRVTGRHHEDTVGKKSKKEGCRKAEENGVFLSVDPCKL